MKRALNVSTLVLVLGISASVYAGPGQDNQAKHAADEKPAAETLRPELRPKLLPEGLTQYPTIEKDVPETEVKVSVTTATETIVEVTVPVDAVKRIKEITTDAIKLRSEVHACPAPKDISAVHLGDLMDDYFKQIQTALTDKKEDASGKPVAAESRKADERTMATRLGEILSLLKKRGEVLDNEFKPFATDLEKSLADSLKESLKLVLGGAVDVEKLLKDFEPGTERGNRFSANYETTENALKALALADTAEVCQMGAPAKAKPEAVGAEVAKNEFKPEQKAENKPADAPAPTKADAPVVNADKALNTDALVNHLNAYLKKTEADLAKNLAEQTQIAQKGLDEFKRQADEIAKQRAKADEIAKMDDKKKQEELLKALLGKQKDEQKQMQHPQQPMAAAPAGGGKEMPQQQQQDPMANQQQQQQDPNAQQNQMAQWMQMMQMQQMMNPQQTQSTQPTYQVAPSTRWDDIYSSRNNRLSSSATPAADPAKGAMMAQQELLTALRQAGQLQMGAPNAYGQQPGNGGGMMSNRLFSQQSAVNGRRNQVNTSGVSSLSSTANGPAQLAGSPMGRTSTIPTDLMPGGAATGTGAGLAF